MFYIWIWNVAQNHDWTDWVWVLRLHATSMARPFIFRKEKKNIIMKYDCMYNIYIAVGQCPFQSEWDQRVYEMKFQWATA